MTELHLRTDWTSRPVPNGTPQRLVGTGFLHHEGGGIRGNPADKAAVLRGIEARVLTLGYSSIDYNVMVFQDGSLWEGRGWTHEDAATLNWNALSVSVCAVGNFELEDPTPELLAGIAIAFQLAQLGGWLTRPAAILGHRQSGFSTACPGARLFAKLDTIRTLIADDTPAPEHPAPPPAPPTPEEALMGNTVVYAIDKLPHTVWVRPDKDNPNQGDLCQTWGRPAKPGAAPPSENMSAAYLGGLKFDTRYPVTFMEDPYSLGARLILAARDVGGRMIRMDYTHGLGWASWAS